MDSLDEYIENLLAKASTEADPLAPPTTSTDPKPTPTDNIQGIANELAAAGTADGAEAVDLSKVYPDPEFLLFQDGIGFLPIGDIVAVTAKSKNGKSHLCALLAASILGNQEFGFKARRDIASPTVLYLDTEQNVLNTAKLVRKVHNMMGWATNANHTGFMAYNMRKMDTGNRWPYVQRVIKEIKPTAVFIDGVADLIGNFNDVEQSNYIVNELMRVSAEEQCAVINVIHTNKGKDDNNMKGHLGTALLQKSSDVFEVKRDKVSGIFSVTQTDCRNAPVKDFAFALDCYGIPHSSATIRDVAAAQKEQSAVEECRATLIKVFDDVSGGLSYGSLAEAMALYGGYSVPTAKRKIKDVALAHNLITVHDKSYFLA